MESKDTDIQQKDKKCCKDPEQDSTKNFTTEKMFKDYLSKVEPNSEAYIEGLYEYANWLWQHKRYKTSEYYCRQIIACRPDHFKAHNRLGTNLKAMKDYEQAEKHYLLAIAHSNHQWTIAYNNLGNLYSINLEHMEEAKDCYERALQLDPNYLGAHVFMCHFFFFFYFQKKKKMGLFENAKNHYKKAIEINPNDSSIYFNLASLLDDMNESNLALSHCRKLLSLDPKHAGGFHSYAIISHQNGNLKVAEKCFFRSLEFDNNSSLTHHNYALLLMETLQIDDALYHLNFSIDIAAHLEKDFHAVRFLQDYKRFLCQAHPVMHFCNVSCLFPFLMPTIL
ncbi:TPR Domain containing protein [Reticulomyxa filosa]|uniref:TPR Domain containing protein n=1 Tax=Reticulomyxa filosa TaxID=46433 RepID=X6MSM8_RETFI|nr:TPR Domain containing protein [Reticulomyxa filosa]|eukprot:ETO16115.1 TPR Domain containing protein [Reticulomyxa filosa]